MALTNYGGRQLLNCKIELFAGTGYTVDHLPKNAEQLTTRPAWTNIDAKYLTVYGIGFVRIAIQAGHTDSIDYCRITPTDVTPRDTASGNSIVTGSLPASQISYFYVTGNHALNGGVVEFYLMLDCYTTLASAGVSFADYGGMLTRIPVNIGGSFTSHPYTEFNTLVEPFTTCFRLKHLVKVLTTGDFTSDMTDIRRWEIILSPYDLAAGAESGATTTHKLTGTGKLTSTTSETGSDETSEEESTTVITPYKPVAADETLFSAGKKSTSIAQSSFGTGAFSTDKRIKEYIAQLYGVGISNACADAYQAIVSSTSAFTGLEKPTTIAGVDGSAKIELSTTDPDLLTFNKNQKSSYYGRYVTLISLSSGQSQTVDWVDCANEDGTITIALASDPSPNGCLYMRIRKTTENIPDKAIEAMLPGHVCSSPWKRLGIVGTLNGRGVELGQSFRSAELDIDGRTAQLNAEATAAQYDMSIGNGYILQNAGNRYGLQRLRENNRASALQYTTQRDAGAVQFGLRAAANAAGTIAKSDGGIDNPFAVGGAAVGALSDYIDYSVGFQQTSQSLDNMANLNSINAQQMMDSGQYNMQLLSAQSVAAQAVSEANIQKVALQRTKLQDYPTIPVLSQETRGILNGASDKFVLVETYMSQDDVTRFEQMLQNFGQATYTDPKNCTDENGDPLTPAAGWNFYKLDAPGNKWPNGTRNKFPAWMIKGAYDQLSSGVWFYSGTAAG